MTVLLFQPSPTEKLLKRSKFSAILWIRYRRRLESGGKRSTLDSCFCTRKRSSSSWTWCTKSFSVGERKTPSKQRRARVTGGRACGADGQGRDQSTDPEPPQPRSAARGSETLRLRSLLGRERRRLGGGEGTCPRSPARQQKGFQAPAWARCSAREPDAAGPLSPCCARLPQARGLSGLGGESGRPGPHRACSEGTVGPPQLGGERPGG